MIVKFEASLGYIVKPCFERGKIKECDITKQRKAVPLVRIHGALILQKLCVRERK